MQSSARMTAWMCAAFALVCAGFVGSGLLALRSLRNEAERELARGYAGFWLVLFTVAVAFALISHLLAQGKLGAAAAEHD